MQDRILRIKEHLKEHQEAYIIGCFGIIAAGITYAIMRERRSDQDIQDGCTVLAKGGTTVLGRSLVMNNVSYFNAERQGPPSWVVRCLETGIVFTSQSKAASEMGLDPSNLSKHLNGLVENAQGYHFERLCMAA